MIRNNWIRRQANRLAEGLLCCAYLAGMLTPAAKADVWDKKTTVTFSAPVEIPGKALPAGTYVFKLLDTTGQRNIVQIVDKDEKQLYATILAIPDYHLKPTDDTVIRFEERPSDTPPALKAWFYPGDQYGARFVYPHDQATQLARRTNQDVLSMKNEMKQNIGTAATSASDSGTKEMQDTDVTAVKPSGRVVAYTTVVSIKPE
jgi:hypothetical protein